jgi:hypothetical protein
MIHDYPINAYKSKKILFIYLFLFCKEAKKKGKRKNYSGRKNIFIALFLRRSQMLIGGET